MATKVQWTIAFADTGWGKLKFSFLQVFNNVLISKNYFFLSQNKIIFLSHVSFFCEWNIKAFQVFFSSIEKGSPGITQEKLN